MSIEVRAQDTGDGRDIWLDIDGGQVWKESNINISWTSWRTISYSTTVSVSSLSNSPIFRFGLHQAKDYFWTDAIWFFNTANVTFTAS
jgi:hypothetical protein